MSSMKKWLGLIGISLLLAAGSASAALQAGREYKPLTPPQPVETGAKIEVIEFFWYSCPHCYDLEPTLKKWVARLPKDVEFRRIPAVLADSWAPNARTFYTLEALGELGRLHGDVFDAIHAGHVRLENEKIQFEWMAKKGIDGKKFSDAWNSFSVQSKTKRAEQLTHAYGIDARDVGVPALIVDGKYLTMISMAGGPDQLMKVLDELIAKARSERGSNKKK